MALIGRRHFLFGGCGLIAGCAKPLTSRTDPGRYLGYEAKLRRQMQETDAALDDPTAAALLEATNAHRRLNFAAPLTAHPELARAAHAHLATMQAEGFFAHNTPDGFTPNDRSGLLCRSLIGGFGENLLMIEGGARPTAARLVEMWAGSPGHNANMLKADFTHVGHAVLRHGRTTHAAAVFGLVVSVMPNPMPLEASGRDLGGFLTGARPRIIDYVVSEPTSGPYRELFPVSGGGPRLAPGAWRLRPLRPQAGQGLQISYGPIFFVT